MKQLIFCIFTALLFLQAFSTSWAMQLSVNQERYVPGDELVLTLIEDWPGEAEVYVAMTLPADDVLWFLMPPQNFWPDLVPYAVGVSASGSREILKMPLPVGLPVGEYTFYATAMYSIFDRIDDVAETSFIYATEAEPVELVLGDIRFPDGVMGRRYSLALEPESGTPPYQFSLSSGTLPNGLTLDKSSGLIQGEPSTRGFAEFTVQVVDGQGNTGEIPGAIKVYGVLTFGEHGTFKGCNGLQMAFNDSQELDEIRIQQGIYECNGLEIPSNKQWKNGIKISGGWNGSFENQSDDPTLTVFDGGAKIITDVKDEEKCNEIGGVWKYWSYMLTRCFQEEIPNNGILKVFDGPVSIEILSFQNGYTSENNGGAIFGNGSINITNSIFTNNSASAKGGAVYEANTITNSIFTNNSASFGGAVSNADTIINSTFTNNKASGGAGAVADANTITNSTFTSNIAENAGAASSVNTITNSIFSYNSAFTIHPSYGGYAGALSSVDTITNSTFISNSATKYGGAIYGDSIVTNSTFINNRAYRGGAIYGVENTIINCTIVNNSSGGIGGGFYGTGKVLNSIFHQNTAHGEANDITPYSDDSDDLNLDYNLVNNLTGTYEYGTHNIMGDPQFVDADNGDFRLLPGSPAINIGDNTVLEQSVDLDGNPRVVGGTIDLGAYERQ
ncbi:choice-of-anchor Q domain-containing protein [Candidatus Parabeggiatoa sp. HSG14]|uniref:choice-of-anchor Q domain-containing protein n=1 Tax=Candidatus Parabeggiatoa sp. HSG14 TaxID=3055593 RepID=UPI0025A8D5C3|nr:choice-of-anchor Q domain-containing protein [Thiotrichales bacterium HSG14]